MPTASVAYRGIMASHCQETFLFNLKKPGQHFADGFFVLAE